MPTKGPERQEVIIKGQSAYRRIRVLGNYQQRPECLPKDQSVKKLSAKARVPTEGPERQEVVNNGQSAKLERTTKRVTRWKPHADRTFLYDGSTYKHQQSWGSWQPNSRGQQATRKKANKTPYQNDNKMKEADHKTTYDKTITTPNAR